MHAQFEPVHDGDAVLLRDLPGRLLFELVEHDLVAMLDHSAALLLDLLLLEDVLGLRRRLREHQLEREEQAAVFEFVARDQRWPLLGEQSTHRGDELPDLAGVVHGRVRFGRFGLKLARNL